MTRHEEENAFTVEATLRTFPPVAPFVVKWAHPVFTVESSLDPERLSKRPGRPSKWQAFDLLQFLPKDGSTMPDWQKKAAKKKGVPRTTFYRLASELEADGIVATDEREIVRQIVIESQNPEVRVYADK